MTVRFRIVLEVLKISWIWYDTPFAEPSLIWHTYGIAAQGTRSENRDCPAVTRKQLPLITLTADITTATLHFVDVALSANATQCVLATGRPFLPAAISLTYAAQPNFGFAISFWKLSDIGDCVYALTCG